ncbi:MAG: hypothetical protein K2K57_15035 [Oscillospiraceae bacterium]|nr:hypothetical protein [Oscillospiraceae bacterium]
MKYIFLAFKTIAAVIIVVLGMACLIYVIGIKAYFGRMAEETRITNEYKEESFNKLCDFAENNLDELLELSDMYISMLSPENSYIDIEAEGDMQEFRNKLFDNVYKGYALIDGNGEKSVVYRSDKGGFTEYIIVEEKENSITSERISGLPGENDISDRVFVFNYNNDH